MISFRRVATIAVALAALIPCAAAQSAQDVRNDAARLAPADSLIYCGWGGEERPSVLFRVGRTLVGALAQRSRTAEAPVFPALLEFADPLFSRAGGCFLTRVEWNEGNPDFGAALISFAGDGGDRLSECLERLVRSTQPRAAIEDRLVDGTTCRAVRLGDSPLTLHWARIGAVWVAGIGAPATAAAIRAARDGAPAALASRDEFGLCRRKTESSVGGAPRSLRFEWWMDVPALFERLRPFADAFTEGRSSELQKFFEHLGLGDFRAIYYRSDDTPRGLCSRFFIHSPGPPRGVLRLWRQAALNDDDLRVVPADAYWALVYKFDFARAWKQLLETADAVDPAFAAQLDSSLSLLDTLLGLSVVDDWLAAFGDTWAIYDAPANGGLLLSGTVFIIDAKDPAAIDRIYRKVVALFAAIAAPALPGVEIAVKDFTADGREFRSAVLGGLPAPLAVTWTFVGNKIVIGLTPQAVRAAAAQADAKTRRTSVLDNPEFQTGRAVIPPGASSISFTDARHLASLLYPLVNHYALAVGSMASVGGASVNLAALPTLDETLAECRSVVGGCTLDDDGILYCQIGSGLSIWNLAYGGLLASVFVMPLAAEVSPLGPTDGGHPPAFDPMPTTLPARSKPNPATRPAASVGK